VIRGELVYGNQHSGLDWTTGILVGVIHVHDDLPVYVKQLPDGT